MSDRANYNKSAGGASGAPESREMAFVVVPIQLGTLYHGAVRPNHPAHLE
jgi:hypothetical protein